MDLLSYAMGKAAAGGGGGGGNRAETINGTLDAPWGERAPAALMQAFASGQTSGYISITAGNATANAALLPDDGGVCAMGAFYVQYEEDAPEISMAFRAFWTAAGLAQAYVTMEGVTQDILESAELVTTVVLLLDHPMPPEEEGDGA